VRALEIARNQAVDTAEISAREAVEAARIAQDRAVAAERIAAELVTKELEIRRAQELEAAELKRRDAVERRRIATELGLEEERIASTRTRELLQIDQKRVVEVAEEERAINLAGKRVERTEADRSLRQAEITTRQEVERADVAREQVLEAARLERRRAIEQLEVARTQALQEAQIASNEEVERARIASDRGLDEARVGRQRELRKLEIARERDVESAAMDKAITLFAKSLEESAARAQAETARVAAVEAEERVKTVRESEEARRRQTVEVLLAETAAEETRIAAEADRVRRAVEADAQRLLYEAENVLSDGARYGLFRRRLLDRIEGIVRESVRPMEKIEGIRILHVDGLAGTNGNGGGGGGGNARSPTDEVIESALRYRVQAPMIDQVLKEIGIEGGNLARMGGLMREASDLQRVSKEAGSGAPKGDSGAAPNGGRRSPSRRAARLGGPARRPRRREARWREYTSQASLRLPPRGSGRACVTSTGCRVGTRQLRKAGSRTGSRRQGRLHPGLLAAQRRPAARATARIVGLRHVLHLLDPRLADAADELRRRPSGSPRSRTASDLHRVVVGFRLRPGARGGACRRASAAMFPGRL
jgi:hypothetical protein